MRTGKSSLELVACKLQCHGSPLTFGVELGQMAVAALVLPLIWWLRNKPAFARRLVPACSALVVLAGAWWLLQRTLPE